VQRRGLGRPARNSWGKLCHFLTDADVRESLHTGMHARVCIHTRKLITAHTYTHAPPVVHIHTCTTCRAPPVVHHLSHAPPHMHHLSCTYTHAPPVVHVPGCCAIQAHTSAVSRLLALQGEIWHTEQRGCGRTRPPLPPPAALRTLPARMLTSAVSGGASVRCQRPGAVPP